VCVCTHVFHLLTCMLSKAGQGLLICKLSLYSGTSLKAICICVLSLRVMHTDEKIQMCVCVCVCVIDFDSAEADLSYSPDVATQGYLPWKYWNVVSLQVWNFKQPRMKLYGSVAVLMYNWVLNCLSIKYRTFSYRTKCVSANQYIRMISDGSCDTVDWSSNAENSSFN